MIRILYCDDEYVQAQLRLRKDFEDLFARFGILKSLFGRVLSLDQLVDNTEGSIMVQPNIEIFGLPQVPSERIESFIKYSARPRKGLRHLRRILSYYETISVSFFEDFSEEEKRIKLIAANMLPKIRSVYARDAKLDLRPLLPYNER